MTDKEKLQDFLQHSLDDFESILFGYLALYGGDFSAMRIHSIIGRLDRDVLLHKIVGLERANANAIDRALFLKEFLEGKMYTTEEAARANVGCQIVNANSIIEYCSKAN